ncbi:MAG: DUF3048 domain-containing protein [Anaerolineae bacterium]|nr:DUF3048 domain-containing protein [Anaerolineae bacterium]
MRFRFSIILLLLTLTLAACSSQTVVADCPPCECETAIPEKPSETPTITLTPTASGTPTLTPRATQSGATPMPAGYNPLTGQMVDDPAVLDRRPLVVKISNESPEVRPQSGLSFADHVWEYQMEGFEQTRYTAIYYSRAPERAGSVRSVRLIDVEHLVPMYDGLLVYSGCSTGMCYRLSITPWYDRAFRETVEKNFLVRLSDVPRPGTNRYHTLFLVPDELWKEADLRGVNQAPVVLHPLTFSSEVPESGIPTTDFIIDYPDLGPRHHWRYFHDTQRWYSFTEDQRMRDEEAPDIDMLTDKQLAFDNIVLIYAEHYLADFIEDEPNQLASVGINLIGNGDAVLMRDGNRYNCRWLRDSSEEMISLVDFDGNPLPLRPGTVWFNVFSSNMFQPDVSFGSR